MAGFIFSIYKEENIEGVKKCIKQGVYASRVPNDKLLLLGNEKSGKKSKQVIAAVLADYCSMQAGDNVYFLSDRHIYGVGKLVNVGMDCKYKIFLDENTFEKKDKVVESDQPLMQLGPEYRWLCLFEPDEHFFMKGVDMDEILSYRPLAFRMLRAFQDVTFIKVDDEENRALKECIYLKNRDKKSYFEYNASEHERILQFDLEKYLINLEEIIIKEFNYEKNEINIEMLLEAWMIDFISKNGFEGEKYDYVTHQVIASPFKPLAYIDKMDIFAYKYLEDFPGAEKPIEKYMVMELKKGKATRNFPLQLMKYVDWISKEYAAGDYSLIKAVGIAKEYPKGMQKIVDEQCNRSYLSELHPNITVQWNDLSLYEYSMNQAGQILIGKSNIFDPTLELKERLLNIGLKYNTGKIQINGEVYSPKFKICSKKWAFFEGLNENEEKITLDKKGWTVTDICEIKSRTEIDQLILEILKKDLYKNDKVGYDE
jgi:hypothetical protein